MIVRLLPVVITVVPFVVAAGCGLGPIPEDLSSGIAGIVLAGPQCPVVQEGSDCNDKPLATTIIVRSAATGREVTRFTSDIDGSFRVPLYPGTYELDPQPGSASGLPYASPQTVKVQADAFTDVTILYDTGIR